MNQRLTPDDYRNDPEVFSVRVWEQLGGSYAVNASGRIVVELSDLANGTVVADSVRIVAAGPGRRTDGGGRTRLRFG